MKKLTHIFLLLTTLAFTMNVYASANHTEEVFEKAWNNPNYTQIQLDDLDINWIISNYYDTATPVHFTRDMLWDMETKKALDPLSYIPYVVKDGKSWGVQTLANGDKTFVRSSHQKQWLDSDQYEEVFEEVYLNQQDQIATFLGTQTLENNSGECLYIENHQPLFHVQHGVAGDENNPLNVWRIVHLTEQKDQKLINHFKKLNDPTTLPGFVQMYIENDLGIPIKRKPN